MGFGNSASHIVFFIAAVVVAAGVVGAFSTNVSKLTGHVNARSDALNDELSTDIRIINDPGEMPNGPLVLYVLNTGSRSLDPNSTVVLLNGEAKTTFAFDVLESTEDVWRHGQVLQITLTGTNLPAGDHRVKVVVDNGVSDTLRFNIP